MQLFAHIDISNESYKCYQNIDAESVMKEISQENKSKDVMLVELNKHDSYFYYMYSVDSNGNYKSIGAAGPTFNRIQDYAKNIDIDDEIKKVEELAKSVLNEESASTNSYSGYCSIQ